MKRIICLFLRHKDTPHDVMFGIAYSWKCNRCERVRWYER